MNINENQLSQMSFGDVLDYSVTIFKRNFIKMAKIIIIMYLPIVLLNALVSGTLISSQFGMYVDLFSGKAPNFNPANQFGTKYIVFTILSYLMSFIMLAYTFCIQSVMDAAIIKTAFDDAVYGGSSLGIKALIKISFKKWVDLFVNKLLYYLIYSGIVIAATIAGAILIVPLIIGASGSLGGVTATFVIVVLSIIIVLAVLTAALYFILRVTFGKVAVVVENQSGSSSISRSWNMTKGNFIHISTVLTFGVMLLYFAPLMLSGSFYILTIFNREILSKVTIAAYTVMQISTAFVYPFVWILCTITYINLKIKKEGYDLEVRVDKMMWEQAQAENKTDNLELS